VILTDREIHIALEGKAITIDPPPQPLAYSSTSLDLTLDPRITVFRQPTDGVEVALDPTHPTFHPERSLQGLTESLVMDGAGYLLNRNVLVLAWTRESVELKLQSRIAARVEGKSSLARLGIGVHVTAPTIHAGFRGQIRLEMINHGCVPVRLREGMRICQLIFEQSLGTPERGYKGMFASQGAAA
jgi:dCTP deaminase